MPFRTFPLLREDLQAILPCGHPLTEKESLSLHDLESEVFIMPGEGPNHQIGQLIRKYQLNLNICYSVSDDNLTVSMVSQNLGVSILPKMSFENYLNMPFVSRKLEEKPCRELKIIYNDLESISPISRAFITFVQNYFRRFPVNS